MSIALTVALLFVAWIIGEALVIYLRARRAKSPIIKIKGREIKYDKANH